MKSLFKPIKGLFFNLVACLLGFTLSVCAYSIKPPANYSQADREIEQLYHEINAKKNLTLNQRLHFFSAYFKNKPYQLGALGEGEQGLYDQYPLYRTDAFDCLTYVETVIALSLSNNLEQFTQTLKKIRYHNGQANFIQRNHFTSLDWNKNNQHLLKDITTKIIDKTRQPIYKTAIATINKPAWYSHFTTNNIRLSQTTPNLTAQRLHQLKQQGRKLAVTQASINYLPISKLFSHGKAKQELFNQIPDGAIIEIVRPNWNLADKIGTCLNVSHLGFAIRKNGKLYFREASQLKKKVRDSLLAVYLKKYINSPTVKGINIQRISNNRN